jgi:hypothetical protein
MKKAVFIVLAALSLIACSKKDDGGTTYTNKLEFGTGLNSADLFQLTGVGTTFASRTTIYFRLESESDMAGSPVTLRIENPDGSTYDEMTFSNPQSTGHILISSFSLAEPGSYTVVGILANGSKTVASQNIAIN